MTQEESPSRDQHSQDLVVPATPILTHAVSKSPHDMDELSDVPALVPGTSAAALVDATAEYDADISQSVEDARPGPRSRSGPHSSPIPSDIESEANVSDEAFLPEDSKAGDVFGPTAMTRPRSVIGKRTSESRPLSDAQSESTFSLGSCSIAESHTSTACSQALEDRFLEQRVFVGQ